VALLRELGTVRVTHALQQLGPWLFSLFVLEVGRVTWELVGTRAVLGPGVSPSRLVRAQLLAQVFDVIMPAGRASAEAAKASVLATEVGAAHAAAAGTALQLASLVANALWALFGFVASVATPLPRALAISLLVYAGAMCLLVSFVVLCTLLPRVRALARRLPFLHDTLERFAVLIEREPPRLLAAVGAHALARGCQALQIAALCAALGGHASLQSLVMGQAVYLVGAAAGDLVPAQLGATDAAFVYAAAAFALPPSAAMALALALHAVQVAVAACSGTGALALWIFGDAREPAARVAPISVDEPVIEAPRACGRAGRADG
jgi:hypothetical protein